MWVFTETGFVSAVCDQHDRRQIQVRARDKESMDFVCMVTGAKMIRTPDADYPYRVVIDREDFIIFLTKSAQYMDYTNFKNQVHATRGKKYARALNSIWSTMHDVEDADARHHDSSEQLVQKALTKFCQCIGLDFR